MRGKHPLGLVLAVVIAVLVQRAAPAHSSHSGVVITALAIDPLTPTTLYAWTNGGGLFKSTDGGANWSATGLTNNSGRALAIDPITPTTLYAGADGGVFKSTDGGASWNATGLSFGVSSLAIDPVTPTTLYAGETTGAVFKSTDGGASWGYVYLILYEYYVGGGVLALAIDPLIPTTLFGGTEAVEVLNYPGYTVSGHVYTSTNGGGIWAGGFGDFDDLESVQALAIVPRTDPWTPATLYAGTYGANGVFSAVFKSTDAGVGWNATGLTGVRVYALAIDPLIPTTLYAGTESGGVFKSSDGGASWSATGLTGVGGVLTLAIDPLTPTTLYAGTGTSGVYKSTNGGVNWNPTGLITWSHISSVSLNPTSVVGGSSSTGTVTLSAAAPAGGAVVALGTDS